MKRCSKCGETKPVSEFNKNARLKSGLYSWCKTCARANSRHWYHANRERNLANMKVYREANRDVLRERDRRNGWRYMLKSRYRMTVEEHNAMLARQNNVCAICALPMAAINIDHDHRTGAVRGLLCGPCNQGLGRFRDSPSSMRAAAKYVEGWLKKTKRSA